MKWLAEHRGTTWLETGLLDEIIAKQGGQDTVLFVDVGGNIGNVCVDLGKKLPEVKGRVVNQDLPHVVSKTLVCPEVEQSPADFWVGQPIEGAKVYYMRNVLRDYSDARALKIMKNILAAMNSESEIWVDEMVVPNTGANEMQVNFDLTMLIMVGRLERSQGQWGNLLEAAGFEIRKIWTVDAGKGESVIVAVPK